MKTYCTPESALRNETSIFAIIETTIVLSFSLFFAIYYNYYWHIAIGTSLGFFLLLRTDASISRGLKWYVNIDSYYSEKIITRYEHVIEDNKWVRYCHSLLIVVPLFGCIALFIKIFATVFTVLQRPLYSIKEIPLNWFRIAFAVDIKHPPEILPGIETFHQDEFARLDTFRWKAFIDFIHESFENISSESESEPPITLVLNILFFYVLFPVTLFICLFIPAYLYRFSLKSTTLIYFPLIWLIGKKDQKQDDINLIVADLLDSKFERVKYHYSWFAILILTIFPLCLSFYWQNLINIPSEKGVLIYFFPLEQIGSWHITRVVSALITIALIVFLDKRRVHLNYHGHSFGQVETFFIKLAKRIRTVLSIWTLACGFYIIMSIVDWTTFPLIKWLPF